MPNAKDPAVKAAKQEPAKKETVKLLADHTHAGKPLKAGAEIEVNARQKAFLVEHKKIAG